MIEAIQPFLVSLAIGTLAAYIDESLLTVTLSLFAMLAGGIIVFLLVNGVTHVT